ARSISIACAISPRSPTSPSGTSTGSASVNKTTDPGPAGDGEAPVLAVVSDLFFVARIRETGRLAGVRVEFARTPAEIQAACPPPARRDRGSARARAAPGAGRPDGRLRLRARLHHARRRPRARSRLHDPRAGTANAALARAVRSRRDEGDAHPGAAASHEGRS